MPRNGSRKLTRKLRDEALARLCDGDTVEEVAETLNLDDGELYGALSAFGWMEAIERARASRMVRVARNADDRAAEWAEHDRQEKDAATAIQSAVIRMIPRDAGALEALEQADRFRAIREINMLADSGLKAQKMRRIASGRPTERTEVETDADARLLAALKAARGDTDDGEDGSGAGGGADGVSPPQPAAGDPAEP